MAQLRDLIVTGAARFLNNIYGNLIGNASTADKVNHRIAITSGGSAYSFDGSTNVDIAIDASSLGLGDSMRIIGVVDENYTQFDDNGGNGGYVTSNLTIVVSGNTTHVIFLSEVISQNCNSTTVNIQGGGSTNYYVPKVGDVVLQDDEEFICVEKTATQSKWRALDSSGYWGTY